MSVDGMTTSEAPMAEAPPVVESSERARQREIAAYLSAASFPQGLPSGPIETPFINADPTLNALVQLGALRLDCARSFLSLIDREHQYVVAEMTRTHSLHEPKCAPGDSVYTGVCKLDACYGICPTTMKAFMDETGEWIRMGPNVIANRTRYIINDFRIDSMHMDKPYVTGHAKFVSYLEVPVISPLGYVLGSYCVVDDKLNDFDNDLSIGTMSDIASTIMAHLDLMKMKQNRHRSDQLIEGLSDFIGYESPVPYPLRGTSDVIVASTTSDHSLERQVSVDAAELIKQDDSASANELQPTATPSGSSLAGASDSVFSPPLQQDLAQTPPTTPPSTVDQDPFEQLVIEDEAAVNRDGSSPKQQTPASEVSSSQANGFIASADIKSTFLRATNTMRQAMNMDGFMFLDAVPRTFASRADQPATEEHHDAADEETQGPSCAAIVQCVVDAEGQTSLQPSKARLAEKILQRFIRRFPRGHVFSADEFGPIDNSYGPGKAFKAGYRPDQDDAHFKKDVDTLFQIIPPAKYIIFLPLWHFQRECWYAAALGWVADPTQAIDIADISLLSAFGNSVMAEVSRIEAMAANRAKSNFVSSVSHELRSPLHGILASSELLRSGISEPSLISILDMLDSCGTLLLDTFSNLLDHAKITNAAKSSTTSAAETCLTDLSELVEDVVEVAKISHTSENSFKSSAYQTGIAPEKVAQTEKNSPDHPMLVVLDIEKRPSWKTQIDVGAWKRIVMNIFGNALKYTKSGHIEISLKIVQRTTEMGRLCDQISFLVEDTGRGMSSDFVKYQLFTPFSQEDNLSPGMGLGLSIVQQLVRGLGGTVEVKSSVGVGSSVEVLVPLSQELPGYASDLQRTVADLGTLHSNQHLNGRTIGVITPEAYVTLVANDANVTREMRNRSALVERSLRSIARDGLGVKLILGTQQCPVPEADIYLLDCNIVNDTFSGHHTTFLPAHYPQISPLIILCSGTGSPSCSKHAALRGHKFHLHHPIGSTKLASVLSSALLAEKEDATPDYPSTSCETPRAASVSKQLIPLSFPENTPASLESPQAASQEMSSIAPIVPPGLAQSKRSLHLLLVDDNPINIKLLTTFVRKLDHTFVTACNGLEAVGLFRDSLEQRRPFDLIFMDISMPVMNGFEATREIREVERAAGVARCKVVVLTGLSSDLSRNEAFASGTDLFLTKPVRLNSVRKLLDDELDESSQSAST